METHFYLKSREESEKLIKNDISQVPGVALERFSPDYIRGSKTNGFVAPVGSRKLEWGVSRGQITFGLGFLFFSGLFFQGHFSTKCARLRARARVLHFKPLRAKRAVSEIVF